MKLLAVRTARFITAISTEELNPRGLVIYPSLIEGLIDKYNFDTYPDEDTELNETTGIVFENGVWNNILIEKITIFNDGIVIDTRSSTKDSEAIFDEAIKWASESVGIVYEPEMVTRKVYVSEIIFHTELPLGNLNPALQAFSRAVSKSVPKETRINADYSLMGLTFHYDSSEMRFQPAAFRIERLENTAFSDNKYYSSAPLSTEDHLKLLEEFEGILVESGK